MVTCLIMSIIKPFKKVYKEIPKGNSILTNGHMIKKNTIKRVILIIQSHLFYFTDKSTASEHASFNIH